ncbi:MAG: DUF1622 domain-containing protein [Actinomycetota bacterium]
MSFTNFVETVGKAADAAGVVVIAVGVSGAMLAFARRILVRNEPRVDAYVELRRNVGRSILLGLELLVAGDIIRTVAISPTFTSVGVLAVIVAVRTFLSFTLEVELTSRWPWQPKTRNGAGENSASEPAPRFAVDDSSTSKRDSA